MKFIPARELRINPGKIWKSLDPEDPLVVTSNGKPIALLCGTDAESLESTLEQWKHVRFLRALKNAQEISVKAHTDRLSPGEIDREIALVRKKRRGKK